MTLITVMMQPDEIADAASIILLRGNGTNAQVLMGQRHAGAAFMPSKFVFPGGRVDTDDYHAPRADILAPGCRAALQMRPWPKQPSGESIGKNIIVRDAARLPDALVAAGLRELGEEAGLSLINPCSAALRFVFRAITPPGNTRRFDARFFIAAAQDFGGDTELFTEASGELAQLQWLSLPAARGLDLPLITRIILTELAAGLAAPQWPSAEGVAFFDNSDAHPAFVRL